MFVFQARPFTASVWAHKHSKLSPFHKLQSQRVQTARGTKRHHGGAFAPVGARNRQMCDLFHDGLTSVLVSQLVNAQFEGQLRPITASQAREVKAQHRNCPKDSVCIAYTVLETRQEIEADSESVALPYSKVSALSECVSEAADSDTYSYGVGTDTLPEKPIYRSMMTRYGWLTYPVALRKASKPEYSANGLR